MAMEQLTALRDATMALEPHPVGTTKVPVDLFLQLIDILVEAMESPAPSSSETSRARTPKGERA